MKNWNIVTSSYVAFKNEMGVPVRTSIGAPKFWRGQALIEAVPLYPYVTFKKHMDKTPKQKCKIYCDALDKKKDNIERMIDDFTHFAQGVPLVFLCYEDVHLGQICHRRWIAEWLVTRFQVSVPEYVKPIIATREPEINPWTPDTLL